MTQTNSDKQHETTKIVEKDNWKALAPMGIAFGMGTFNDNFFKQTALLLSASSGFADIQTSATILFALPFVLCSTWAGWLADKISKQTIVVWAKFLELIAMLIGAVSFYHANWNGVMAVIFIMGLQSTIFSPALNGSIPDNFRRETVPTVNAILKLFTTVTILIGIALSGISLDLHAPESFAFLNEYVNMELFGILTVAIIAVSMALIGFIATLFLKRIPNTHPTQAKFPLWGFIDSVRHFVFFYKKDPKLFAAISVEAFFYFIATIAVLLINNLGLNELGFSKTKTSLMPVSLMVGICLGSFIARKCLPSKWYSYAVPAGFIMGISLLFIPLIQLVTPDTAFFYTLLVFSVTGVAAGAYLIPAVSFIQVRPSPDSRGKTLGCSNFTSFVAIMFAGVVFLPLATLLPSTALLVCGIFALIFITSVKAFLKYKSHTHS
ncbi:MFS transporter [Desulfovibrio litoralis]|uniref:Major Facilitator Superfamily protein n=1 Tax=Desulfovibrio litoralis DSM 11393 TaxID=1121455 RepID=A0A1M7TMP8_9BACT|nr:MFS transporter [Desulfovibrio litoralis]SHN71956.1 Major Facilitator Superfamily protein [Desulfovibrio litoralis DSM 11393]